MKRIGDKKKLIRADSFQKQVNFIDKLKTEKGAFQFFCMGVVENFRIIE